MLGCTPVNGQKSRNSRPKVENGEALLESPLSTSYRVSSGVQDKSSTTNASRVHKMLVPCTTYKSKWSKLLKLWIFGQPVVEVLILLVVVVFCCDSAGTTTVQFCTLTPVQRVTRRGRYLAYSTSRPASPRSVWWLIQQPTCCHVVVSRYWAIWLHAWFQSLDLLLYHSRTCG